MSDTELDVLIEVADLGDEIDRLMLADALDESGRAEEAQLLRDRGCCLGDLLKGIDNGHRDVWFLPF